MNYEKIFNETKKYVYKEITYRGNYVSFHKPGWYKNDKPMSASEGNWLYVTESIGGSGPYGGGHTEFLSYWLGPGPVGPLTKPIQTRNGDNFLVDHTNSHFLILNTTDPYKPKWEEVIKSPELLAQIKEESDARNAILAQKKANYNATYGKKYEAQAAEKLLAEQARVAAYYAELDAKCADRARQLSALKGGKRSRRRLRNKRRSRKRL